MLGPYGNTWMRTPQFNRLAARSWVADQCFAARPEPHAVLHALWSDGLLHARPWTLLTDDPIAYGHERSSQFADRLLLDMPATAAASAKELAGTQFAALFGKVVELLQQADDNRSIWIHARGMFGPWDAPLELRNQYADEEDPTPPSFTAPPEELLPDGLDPDVLLGMVHAYAGQVSLLDACLGVLLDALEEHSHKDAMTLAVVGTRGYPLGEHRRVGICDAALYGELLHVPLLIYRPSALDTIGRSGQLHTHADLPVLLLNERLREPARDHLIFTSQHERAIRTPAWHLREFGDPNHLRRELYVKPDDLWEVNDVADRCPDIATALAELLADPTTIPSPLPAPLITSIGE